MRIKINEDNSINYRLNSTKTIKNIGTSFSETLNEVENKSTSVDTTATEISTFENDIHTGNELIDNLPEKNKSDVLLAIVGSNGLNNIFDIDILGNPDQFIKKDSTINMPRILSEYGNNVSSKDLPALSNCINILMENGLISNEDYFYTLKWISTKQQSLKVNMNSEENKKSISDLMFKPKTKYNGIHN